MPVKEYTWRDKNGVHHNIDGMETRHLFHVVRMIWDHSMPEEFQTEFQNRYLFPSYYSKDYMALTIRLMLPVLLNRKDLEPYMQYWLDHMRKCILGEAKQLNFVKRIGYDVAAENR